MSDDAIDHRADALADAAIKQNEYAANLQREIERLRAEVERHERERKRLSGMVADYARDLLAERQRARLPEELVERVRYLINAHFRPASNHVAAKTLRDILAWHEGGEQ